VAQTTPEQLVKVAASHTGAALGPVLARQPSAEPVQEMRVAQAAGN